MRGVYVLLIQIEKEIEILVGRLGKCKFSPGYYLYVGSGKNHLEKRVERHLRREGKKLFWHIDYLLDNPLVKVKKVWVGKDIEECDLAKKIVTRKEFGVPVNGFGSSDCRCKAHLFSVSGVLEKVDFLCKNRFCLLDWPLKSDKFNLDNSKV